MQFKEHLVTQLVLVSSSILFDLSFFILVAITKEQDI